MEANRRPLGLYIHIPFCRQKCAYCDFYSLAGNESRMEDYTAALCADLSRTGKTAGDYTVDTVYFGGGTPTCLGTHRLIRILDTVFTHFTVAEDAEITTEANPDSACDPNELKKLRRAGFNRISLGMQSACDEELRDIGRIHTAADTARAVAAAREAGFDNLSLDLIYGLPRQTMARWQENLAAAVALQPQHLSCYGLKVEEGTPLYLRKDTADLPDDEAQSDFYLCTVEYLAAHGYAQYEISNFAHPGRESRHNLKYWRLEEYAGFGPGAHSDFRGRRYAYDRSLESYIAGAAVLSEESEIGSEERAAEWLMLGLRTILGLDPAAYEERFRRSFAPFLPFLRQCEAAGYAVQRSGRWCLTPEGFLRSNSIIAALLEQLSER